MSFAFFSHLLMHLPLFWRWPGRLGVYLKGALLELKEIDMIMNVFSQIWLQLVSLVVLFLLSNFPQLAISGGSVVDSVPGFVGSLPFYLETGYIGVGNSENVQLFYYFVKSESNPEEDPLLVWLTGGPGCSSFSDFAYENGPLLFERSKNDGSFPSLYLNPYSWTKVASIIFLDSPVGTGFSYSVSANASRITDIQACNHTDQFLRKWLNDHPEFISNSFYVAGDSYSGITVPIVTQMISDGNEAGIKPPINLKGYVLGNPVTDRNLEMNSRVPFAHGMALISDEIYESLQKSCQGEYHSIDPDNTQCLQDFKAYNECIHGINTFHILEPYCSNGSPNRRKLSSKHPMGHLALKSSLCEFSQDKQYLLSYSWLNDANVREALHIRKGTIGKWVRCNRADLPYEITTLNSYNYHVNLSLKGYRSLIYSGDHDLEVPFLGTKKWIRSLNYSIIDEWRPWIVEGQVAGYTTSYSNQMTFVTVKGGGHTAPEQRPLECLAMFKRWIAHKAV